MEMFKDMPKFLKSLNFKCLIVLFAISTSFQLFAPAPKKGNSDCYYKLLDVAETASEDDIKKAYRKQSLKWHPDKWNNANPNATEEEKDEVTKKFQKITVANAVLMDANKRAAYDRDEYNPRAAETTSVVSYEKRFTGTKAEVDAKLYAVFKEVCKNAGFKWHETDDLRMALCRLLQPELRLLFLQSRALGLFYNPANSVLCGTTEAERYIEYAGSDRKELARLRSEAYKANEDSLQSQPGVGFWAKSFNKYLFSSALEEARSAMKGGTYKKRLEKLEELMLKHSGLSSDEIFNVLPEGSQREALGGFFDYLQERRRCFACPEMTLPPEINNMPEGGYRKMDAASKFVTEITDAEFENLKINVKKTIHYKIGALLSLLVGGGFLIYAGLKGAKGFYDMRDFNKAKRRTKRKMTPKMILKSVALPVGFGCGCLILRYFILYLKSQVKLSGGFDTTADYVYVPPAPSAFANNHFTNIFEAFFNSGGSSNFNF